MCSKPRSLTVCRTQSSSPYGRPLSMLTRTRSSSFAVKGALTRAVQFAGRSTGQGDNKALIASSPCTLDHRLPHRHSCARSTNPADKGFRSTYRNSGQQMVVTLYRETLESSLIEVPVSHRPVRDAPAHRVRVREPPKKVRQLTVLLRPDDKVPMVGQNTIRQDTNGLPLVRLNHDALERLEVGVLAEHMHPADRSVQDVINKPPRCYSRCSWHDNHSYQNGGSASILIASLFPSQQPGAVTCHDRASGAMICGGVLVDSDEPIEEGILMRPIRIGVLGVLAFVPASWALDEPPGAPSAKAGSLRARLEVIQRRSSRRPTGSSCAVYLKATTDDERRKAVESRPDAKKYVARMMELAESAPDDPAAVDALVWVVRFGGQTKEADRAIERLARDHAQDPKVTQIGGTPANSMSPAAERLLRAIAEKSPDRAVQKRAAFALARLLNNEADLVRRVKQNKRFAASVTQFYGPSAPRLSGRKTLTRWQGRASRCSRPRLRSSVTCPGSRSR